MKIVYDKIPGNVRKLVLAIGFFDGVHIGHKNVLKMAVEKARAEGSQAWAMTFEPHPLAILNPGKAPEIITPLEFRVERIAATGVDGCVILRFTRELSELGAREFIETTILGGSRKTATVIAGENWRFGRNGSGSLRTIEAISEGRIKAILAPPSIDHGDFISSTRIRRAIKIGDLKLATRLLGRPYRIRAKVERGRGVGAGIGFATANLASISEILPPVGVYAAWSGVSGVTRRAVCDIGYHPTFNEARPDKPIVEVHLIGFKGDVYGEIMDLAFIEKLRGETKFASVEDLRRQIARDIDCAVSALGEQPADMFPPAAVLPPQK